MEENDIDRQLVTLLNQLTQIQTQITAIISTRFERQTSENVQTNVTQRQNNVSEAAQRYGQNQDLAEDTIKEYSDALEQIRRKYSEEKNLWLAQSNEFQKKEMRYVLEIAELKRKLDSKGDHQKQIHDGKEKIDLVRKASKESEDNVQDCKNRCNDTIDDISADKDLIKSDDRANIFSKLFTKIKDRIGGKEKFKNNVIEPLKSKANYIKDEVLPGIDEKIEKNVIPKLKSLFENAKEEIKDMNLKEKFTKLMGMAKEGARSIVEKSKQVKDVLVSAFSKGVSLAREGISKVAEKVSDVIEAAAER